MTSGDRILTGLCYEKDVMASINKVTRWSGSHVSMDNVDREAATGWGMSSTREKTEAYIYPE